VPPAAGALFLGAGGVRPGDDRDREAVWRTGLKIA